MDKMILFSLKRLTKQFFRNKLNRQFRNQPGRIDISGISLDFYKSESIGLTGARSSGASTIASILGGEIMPDKGEIVWDDINISGLQKSEYFDYLGKVKIVSPVKIGMLEKTKKSSDYIKERLKQIHQLSEAYEDSMTMELLKSVGLDKEIGETHIHRLNETQLKQIIVARALAMNPKFIIADELTAQSTSQIKRSLYDLLLKIKQRLGIGILMIDNDIANLCNYTDRLGIMLYGRLVEVGMTDEIINSPMHPYTKRLITLSNQRTSLNDFHLDEDLSDTPAPAGCPYALKCKLSEVKCRLFEPELQVRSNGRGVACHNVEEESGAVGRTATGLGMVV